MVCIEGLRRAVFLFSAAKIWFIGVLPRFYDIAPNTSSSRKIGVEMIPITEADRSLQGKKFFCEAAQYLQCRFFVIKKDIAPHSGIRCRYAGKIPKPCG